MIIDDDRLTIFWDACGFQPSATSEMIEIFAGIDGRIDGIQQIIGYMIIVHIDSDRLKILYLLSHSTVSNRAHPLEKDRVGF